LADDAKKDYSMGEVRRDISRLDSLLVRLQQTQDEQAKQILELAEKATSLGSEVLMLQVMGGQLAKAIEEKGALGAVGPVLGAVSSGAARGFTAADMTFRYMRMVERGQVMFGRDVDRERWAGEQGAREAIRVLTGL